MNKPPVYAWRVKAGHDQPDANPGMRAPCLPFVVQATDLTSAVQLAVNTGRLADCTHMHITRIAEVIA